MPVSAAPEPPRFFGPAANTLSVDDPLWADLPARYVVCFHATAGAKKRWAVENWHALGRRLEAEGLAVLLPWAVSRSAATPRRWPPVFPARACCRASRSCRDSD